MEAASAALQEAIWLGRLLREFGCLFARPITLLEEKSIMYIPIKEPWRLCKIKAYWYRIPTTSSENK